MRKGAADTEEVLFLAAQIIVPKAWREICLLCRSASLSCRSGYRLVRYGSCWQDNCAVPGNSRCRGRYRPSNCIRLRPVRWQMAVVGHHSMPVRRIAERLVLLAHGCARQGAIYRLAGRMNMHSRRWARLQRQNT